MLFFIVSFSQKHNKEQSLVSSSLPDFDDIIFDEQIIINVNYNIDIYKKYIICKV